MDPIYILYNFCNGKDNYEEVYDVCLYNKIIVNEFCKNTQYGEHIEIIKAISLYCDNKFDDVLHICNKLDNSPYANCLIGEILFRSENYDLAKKYIEKAAQMNIGYALYLLGFLCENGHTEEKGKEIYLKLYHIATLKNSLCALNVLGNKYINGIDVKKDINIGIELLQKASLSGNLDAMTNLGYYYLNGIGVEENIDEAIKLYELCVSKKCIVAIKNLVIIYLIHDKKKNIARAMELINIINIIVSESKNENNSVIEFFSNILQNTDIKKENKKLKAYINEMQVNNFFETIDYNMNRNMNHSINLI